MNPSELSNNLNKTLDEWAEKQEAQTAEHFKLLKKAQRENWIQLSIYVVLVVIQVVIFLNLTLC